LKNSEKQRSQTLHVNGIYLRIIHCCLYFLKTYHISKTAGDREGQIEKEGGQTAKLIREVEVKKSRGIHSNQNLSRAQLTLGRWRRRRRRRNGKKTSRNERKASVFFGCHRPFLCRGFFPLRCKCEERFSEGSETAINGKFMRAIIRGSYICQQ